MRGIWNSKETSWRQMFVMCLSDGSQWPAKQQNNRRRNVIHLHRVPNMGVFLNHWFYHVTEGRILVVNWLQICSYGCRLYIACAEESHITVSVVLSICSMIWGCTGDPYSDFLSLLVPSLVTLLKYFFMWCFDVNLAICGSLFPCF